MHKIQYPAIILFIFLINACNKVEKATDLNVYVWEEMWSGKMLADTISREKRPSYLSRQKILTDSLIASSLDDIPEFKLFQFDQKALQLMHKNKYQFEGNEYLVYRFIFDDSNIQYVLLYTEKTGVFFFQRRNAEPFRLLALTKKGEHKPLEALTDHLIISEFATDAAPESSPRLP
jgi:hypothetical protein